jgi:hypothetical protein
MANLLILNLKKMSWIKCLEDNPLQRATDVLRNSMLVFYFLFCLSKKEQKRTPAKDYIPFAGWFPDWALVLLWLQHLKLGIVRTLSNRAQDIAWKTPS